MSDYVKDVREHQNGWREGAASRDAEVAELREKLSAEQQAHSATAAGLTEALRLLERERAKLARVTEERDEARAARIAEADAMHREVISADRARDAARLELDAVRAANESVAVCAEHTSRVIGDGCLVCELDAVREKLARVEDLADEAPEVMHAAMISPAAILRALGGDS